MRPPSHYRSSEVSRQGPCPRMRHLARVLYVIWPHRRLAVTYKDVPGPWTTERPRVARSRADHRRAPADGSGRRGRCATHPRLFRRREARSDAAVHGLCLGDLAARRPGDGDAVRLRPPLVARNLRRRAPRQHAAPTRGRAPATPPPLPGAGPPPLGSMIGQQAGNMAEVIVGAWLLRRLIGSRAALDTSEQVSGMLVAVGTATCISATVGTLSMFAGGVIDHTEIPTFWRTWLL